MTNKTPKRILAAVLAASAAAAVLTGLCLYRDSAQKDYVTEMNNAAKNFYNGVNNYLYNEYEGRLPDGAPDNIYYCTYTAQHDDKAGEFSFSPEDGSAFTSTGFTTESFGLSNSAIPCDMYFVLEIRNNAVTRVSACKRKILSAADLAPVRRDLAPPHLSLAEFYLKRFIAYYPG